MNADWESDWFNRVLVNGWFRENPICMTYHTHGDKPTACRMGFVYIAHCGGIFKIGYSNTRKGIKYRVESISSNYGVRFNLIHIIETSCGVGLEHHIHWLFRKSAKGHEMFWLSYREIEQIKSIEEFNNNPVIHTVVL